MKIEIQLRSLYQHAWATAVETVGTFINQALKSSVGEDVWLRFFALMGTAIALLERETPVPGTPSARAELREELIHCSNLLQARMRLAAYGAAMNTIVSNSRAGDHYYLLILDPRANEVTVQGFRSNELALATERYAQEETRAVETNETDVVLVSVDSLGALKKAYPNYFADTRTFVRLLDRAIAVG